MTEPSAEKPKAAAGWYPDRPSPGVQRFWNGQAWTDQRRPTPPPAPVPAKVPEGFSPTASKDDVAYAWTLALLPLVGVVLDLTLPRYSNTGYFTAGFLAVTITLCVLDRRRLTRNGINSPAPAWALLVPGYLISRTRTVGSTAAIPIVWFVAFGASVLSTVLAPSVYSYGDTEISDYIASELTKQAGVDVTVDCPSAKRVIKGDSIECDATDTSGTTVTIKVTFDGDGRYHWQAE